MTSTVAFLVKNGIGFGHLRRALILAEALQSGCSAIRPVVISQASSVDLFLRSTVQVVNFPLLQRLPNEIAEDWYTDVLDQVLNRLDPAVVVEDTYPDPRYARLPSLADRQRVLVLRRLDGLSFDTIRTAGRFAHYDHILIAQEKAAFEREGHSGDTLTSVELSGRFSFVGQIYRTPDQHKARQLRETLAPRGTRLIVVNGGAGGDQMPDGYGDRLFAACSTVADRLNAGGPCARFVFVTGPYYAGRPPRERDNVTIRQFEPDLPELLAAADVAVIKPGHNGLSETLTGGAHLILVPDVSFMEGLDEHSARIVADYGGHVATADADVLETLIRSALGQPARRLRIESPDRAVSAVTDVLRQMACNYAPVTVAPQPLLLAFRPPASVAPEHLRDLLPNNLADVSIIDQDISCLASIEDGKARPTPAVFADSAPRYAVVGDLSAAGTRLILGRIDDAGLHRWLSMPTSGPSMLNADVTVATADPSRPCRLLRHLRTQLTTPAPAAVVVDLHPLDTADALAGYLGQLATWLTRQPIKLAQVDEFTAARATLLLERQ
jgi:predicted glycosyltransferase